MVKINLKDKNPRETQRMRKDVVMNVDCVTRLAILLQIFMVISGKHESQS